MVLALSCRSYTAFMGNKDSDSVEPSWGWQGAVPVTHSGSQPWDRRGWWSPPSGFRDSAWFSNGGRRQDKAGSPGQNDYGNIPCRGHLGDYTAHNRQETGNCEEGKKNTPEISPSLTINSISAEIIFFSPSPLLPWHGPLASLVRIFLATRPGCPPFLSH